MLMVECLTSSAKGKDFLSKCALLDWISGAHIIIRNNC